MFYGDALSGKAKLRDLFAISIHSFPTQVYTLLNAIRDKGAQMHCRVSLPDALLCDVSYSLDLQTPHFEFSYPNAKEEDPLYQFSPPFPDVNSLFFQFYQLGVDDSVVEQIGAGIVKKDTSSGWLLFEGSVCSEQQYDVQTGSYLDLANGASQMNRVVFYTSTGTYHIPSTYTVDNGVSKDSQPSKSNILTNNISCGYIMSALRGSSIPISTTVTATSSNSNSTLTSSTPVPSTLSPDSLNSPTIATADPQTPTSMLSAYPSTYPSSYLIPVTTSPLLVTSPVKPTGLNDYARRVVELAQHQSIFLEQKAVTLEQVHESDSVAVQFASLISNVHGDVALLDDITQFNGMNVKEHVKLYGAEDLHSVIETQEEELKQQERYLDELAAELEEQDLACTQQLESWYTQFEKSQEQARICGEQTSHQLQQDLVKYIQAAEMKKQHQLHLRYRESSLLNEQTRLFPVTSGPAEDCKRNLIEAVLATQKKSKHAQLRISLSQRLELHFSSCGDRVWYIRGIPLFLARGLLQVFTPEMRESTCIALGFVVQLVVLLTKYLRCSLTYPLSYRGSRSVVIVSEQAPPFPLFLKSVPDKNSETAFIEAVNYLNTNVVHLIEARLRPEIASEAKHNGLYLIENLHLLLTHEIASN